MTGFADRVFRRYLRRARRAEDGATTIEFLIWFPFFITLVCSSLEAGLMALQHSMLERSLDLTVRDLRIGVLPDPSHNDLKAAVCSRIMIVPGCGSDILLELTAVQTTSWSLPTEAPKCVDHSLEVQPVTTFQPGVQNELVTVRACIKVRPLFPTTGLGLRLPKDPTGMYALTSASAFVNEPRD